MRPALVGIALVLVALAGALKPTQAPPGPLPGAAVLRVASLGRPEAVATLVWMSTVRAWTRPGAREPEALGARIEAGVRLAGALDPEWKPPWSYGALMLGALGEVDRHERVLRAAMEARPEDRWFPRALAMSRHLQGDAEGASRWLSWARRDPP